MPYAFCHSSMYHDCSKLQKKREKCYYACLQFYYNIQKNEIFIINYITLKTKKVD